MSRIPASFRPASWRGTTAMDPEEKTMGVSFDLDSGEIVRLKLPVESAKHLAEGILEYLPAYLSSSQSPKSSEIPNFPKSIPEDEENV